ncbi:hypothetical protein HMPREF7215_1688 [Pyramidobacter piscolens W5455]|uniref:Uncharacterized protein n=1 Tax=Pyramidobacter piscolens W5455 TaxID=352165 RepID=A0ABP2HZ84_9BACT|nr:hypothetical protein HMPREF7215_1688 [Pyramidobacter piscolens W5455]
MIRGDKNCPAFLACRKRRGSFLSPRRMMKEMAFVFGMAPSKNGRDAPLSGR